MNKAPTNHWPARFENAMWLLLGLLAVYSLAAAYTTAA